MIKLLPGLMGTYGISPAWWLSHGSHEDGLGILQWSLETALAVLLTAANPIASLFKIALNLLSARGTMSLAQIAVLLRRDR